MNICGQSEKMTMATPSLAMYDELPYPPDENRIGSVKSSREIIQTTLRRKISPPNNFTEL
jgi:hypothetical protein